MRWSDRLARPRTALLGAVLTGAALALCACGGDDDGAAVRNLGSEGATGAGASATGAGSGSATGAASGSASGTGAAACSPVGAELKEDAATTVEMKATDFAFDPAQVDVDAGVVTFNVANEGKQEHELAFLPGGAEVPFTAGAPDEAALEAAGAFELEAFGPGQGCEATYDLEPGTYTLFCIVEDPASGSTHYELGMKGTLVVS